MFPKGLAFAAVGAAIGAVVWVILVQVTGFSLWILAPVVGGCAGYGMMRGTQMRGGMPAGIAAGALTLAAIFGARWFLINHEVESLLAFDDVAAVEQIAFDVADEWADEGYEVYDEEEADFLPAVYQEAAQRWADFSPAERDDYIASFEEDNAGAAAVLTPLGLLFDFGLFGTLCAVLAAGTAFKTGSITLEESLIQRGHATGAEDAADLAGDLRANDGGFFARLGTDTGHSNRPQASSLNHAEPRRNAA